MTSRLKNMAGITSSTRSAVLPAGSSPRRTARSMISSNFPRLLSMTWVRIRSASSGSVRMADSTPGDEGGVLAVDMDVHI